MHWRMEPKPFCIGQFPSEYLVYLRVPSPFTEYTEYQLFDFSFYSAIVEYADEYLAWFRTNEKMQRLDKRNETHDEDDVCLFIVLQRRKLTFVESQQYNCDDWRITFTEFCNYILRRRHHRRNNNVRSTLHAVSQVYLFRCDDFFRSLSLTPRRCYCTISKQSVKSWKFCRNLLFYLRLSLFAYFRLMYARDSWNMSSGICGSGETMFVGNRFYFWFRRWKSCCSRTHDDRHE